MNNRIDVPTGYFYSEHLGAEGVTHVELAALAPNCEAAHQHVTDGNRGGLDAGFTSINLPREMPVRDAYVFGQLLDLHPRAAAYAGLLHGINPLDPPSVEKGKRLGIEYLRRGRT